MSITEKIKESIAKRKAAKLLSNAKETLALFDPDNMEAEVYAAYKAAYKSFSPARKRWLRKTKRLATKFRQGRLTESEMLNQFLALKNECQELDRKEGAY